VRLVLEKRSKFEKVLKKSSNPCISTRELKNSENLPDYQVWAIKKLTREVFMKKSIFSLRRFSQTVALTFDIFIIFAKIS
jgi:hypothetical protein